MKGFFSWVFGGLDYLLNLVSGIIIFKLFFMVILVFVLLTFRFFGKMVKKL